MASWLQKIVAIFTKVEKFSPAVAELRALITESKADDGKIDAEEALMIVEKIITDILPILEGTKKPEEPVE